MIDHINICLCICKMTLQRSSLKFIINVIQIDTSTIKIHFNFIAITQTLYRKSPEPLCC